MRQNLRLSAIIISVSSLIEIAAFSQESTYFKCAERRNIGDFALGRLDERLQDRRCVETSKFTAIHGCWNGNFCNVVIIFMSGNKKRIVCRVIGRNLAAVAKRRTAECPMRHLKRPLINKVGFLKKRS